jgi:hypothetical protein
MKNLSTSSAEWWLSPAHDEIFAAGPAIFARCWIKRKQGLQR